MKNVLPLLALLFVAFSLTAQTSAFRISGGSGEHGRALTLNADRLAQQLADAPREFTGQKSDVTISLPLPNGEFAEYTVYDSPLQDRYKHVGAYRLAGPWGGGRLATGPAGVSAVVRGPKGPFVIEPNPEGEGYRMADYKTYMRLTAGEFAGSLACGYDDASMADYEGLEVDPDFAAGGEDAGAMFNGHMAGNEARELRLYDLIVTNTGEFAQRVGGTREAVVEAFNTAVNTMNAIFEDDIGMRLNLVVIDTLIFLDPDTDPFIDADEGGGLLGQVIDAFSDANVPLASYDLGHILTARCNDVGGVVSGRACNDAGKTRGVTCVSGSVVGAALRIMAHEIAHQFAVSHSWNNCPGSEGQRASGTAFEPGAGTTIMSYAGLCGSQNIGGDEAYYHVGSLEQFLTYTRETGARACATVVETDNFTPQVTLDYPDGFFIPVGTPYRLEGIATDANDDDGNLVYNWEQFDLGPAAEIGEPRGNSPLMRSVFPTPEGNVRFFPNLEDIVDGRSPRGEQLVDYSRTLTFRLTARDLNTEAGGVDWEEVRFFTEETAGPFVVDEPAADWAAGQFRQVSWDVANTNLPPVNSQRVNIMLSTDGGETFDVVLARNVANNGSAFVTVPLGSETDEARIMVAAADNVFLNVNATDFAIAAPVAPGFTLNAQTRFQDLCLPEVFTTDLTSASVLGYDEPVELTVASADLPAEADLSLSTNALVPGETATLTADLTAVRASGLVEVVITAVGPGLDTARRSIFLDLTDNDFTDLMTMAPAEGTTGIILATEFDWTDAVNADSYDIEIGTSPDFADGTVFERSAGVTASQYLPEEFFEPNTLYFWRVRPSNLCGDGDWTRPNSFRTVNSACTTYATDDAVGLPGNGPAFERSSTIFVEESGTISDLNIPNILLSYSFVRNVKLTLISPAGTEVILYDERCFFTNNMDLGFDDDAPLPVACPPDDQRVFTPVERLEAFIGEDTFGEWTMKVSVSETGGTAGSLRQWSIEFCADVSATPPQAVINGTTEVPPLGRNHVIRDQLEVISADFGSDEILYTVTALPANGVLTLFGNPAAVGDEFTQAAINGRGLWYDHTQEGTMSDDFGFVVTTPDGGYLPIQYHAFDIFDGATTSDRTVSALDASLELFPNPTEGQVALRWATNAGRNLDLGLFDLNGRLLQRRTVAGGARSVVVDLSVLPAGVYVLRFGGAVRRIVRR